MGYYDTVSDEFLLATLQKQADLCVAIVSMSDEDQNRPGPKGEASPREAGALNAVLCVLAEREAVKRGLVTATLSEHY